MSSGGMLQVHFPEAEGWRNCFPIGDKPESAALAMAKKFDNKHAVRITNRKGRVTFSWKPDKGESR